MQHLNNFKFSILNFQFSILRTRGVLPRMPTPSILFLLAILLLLLLPARSPLPRRRNPIERLPSSIREQVNELLDDAKSFPEILQWLAKSGHPGITEADLIASRVKWVSVAAAIVLVVYVATFASWWLTSPSWYVCGYRDVSVAAAEHMSIYTYAK